MPFHEGSSRVCRRGVGISSGVRQCTRRHDTSKTTGKLLTVRQAAERLGTSVTFPRRLIAERRITFVRIRHDG
jgi:excisionase family DNA binding protein